MARPLPATSALAVFLLLAPSLWPAPATGQERVDGNLYANARYGIQITKPASWYFITAGTILDLAQRAAGNPRPQLPDDPVKAAGFAVIVSKAPTLGRGFEPQVIVLVSDIPQVPENLIQACEGLRAGMTDPQTVRPTGEVQIDGKPAARLDFQGLVDGAIVRATALCAIRERRALLVVGQSLAADFPGEAATFEAILSSFHVR